MGAGELVPATNEDGSEAVAKGDRPAPGVANETHNKVTSEPANEITDASMSVSLGMANAVASDKLATNETVAEPTNGVEPGDMGNACVKIPAPLSPELAATTANTVADADAVTDGVDQSLPLPPRVLGLCASESVVFSTRERHAPTPNPTQTLNANPTRTLTLNLT